MGMHTRKLVLWHAQGEGKGVKHRVLVKRSCGDDAKDALGVGLLRREERTRVQGHLHVVAELVYRADLPGLARLAARQPLPVFGRQPTRTQPQLLCGKAVPVKAAIELHPARATLREPVNLPHNGDAVARGGELSGRIHGLRGVTRATQLKDEGVLACPKLGDPVRVHEVPHEHKETRGHRQKEGGRDGHANPFSHGAPIYLRPAATS